MSEPQKINNVFFFSCYGDHRYLHVLTHSFPTRRSSDRKAAGMHAIRVGLGPTPMLYYAVNELNADGGVMVSGSHNPPEYNGFKFMIGKGPDRKSTRLNSSH